MEANLENPSYGDRDSIGSLQERSHYGSRSRRLNRGKAAQRFTREAESLLAKGFKGSAGKLAQAVQRSAYPDRYDQHSSQADEILSGLQARRRRGASTSTTPGVDRSGDRQALLQQYLTQRHDPTALLGLKKGLDSAQDTPAVTQNSRETLPSRTPGDDKITRRIERFVSRATKIDTAGPSYQWGGGHGARPAKLGTPVDCSGAVAQILRTNPRVSGEMGKVLKPGRGRVNVYYNEGHTFMEIDGKFFGTSGSNPGGGAGWIPRSKMDKAYLKGFKVGHVV